MYQTDQLHVTDRPYFFLRAQQTMTILRVGKEFPCPKSSASCKEIVILLFTDTIQDTNRMFVNNIKLMSYVRTATLVYVFP